MSPRNGRVTGGVERVTCLPLDIPTYLATIQCVNLYVDELRFVP